MAIEEPIIITVIIIFVIFLLYYIILLFNSLIRLKNDIDKAWSNIDVLLKQRYDEIPRLVETVKGYMKHEKTLLRNLTEARAILQKSLDFLF